MIVLPSRFLVLRPRIVVAGEDLTVKTPLWVEILTGFSYQREVHVCSRTQTVAFTEKRLWFSKKVRIVRFRDVVQVEYSHSEAPTSWNILGRAHDSIEWFHVGLRLRDSIRPLHVARFFGEGAAGDLGTWLMGDDMVDLKGTQEVESRVFVKMLCEIIGVGLARPFALTLDAEGRTWTCSQCGRRVPPKPRCLYCGGSAAASDGQSAST
jgi:hypothetical protein